MKFAEENLDVLQNLEFAIVEVWRAHPEMTGLLGATRLRNGPSVLSCPSNAASRPRRPPLTGLDAAAFESLKAMCEFRLGRATGPPADSDVPVPPIPVEKLIACLQELAKSVERHTHSGGRQGYLQFIGQFLK